MPHTAVVVLNYNGAALLRRYLPAVLRHSPPGSVVVADNGSDDDSRELLAHCFPQARLMPFERNLGYAGGYNRALGELGCDYCVLLNSDVAPLPGWLEPLERLLDQHPDVAACQPKILSDADPSRFEYAGAAGGFLDRLGYPYCRGRLFDHVESDHGQYDDTAECHWASGAALMVRRQAFLDAGGLDADFFAHMEEIDLCWRLRLRGFRVMAVGGAAVRHLGGGSLPYGDERKVMLNFRNNLTMLTKNLRGRWWVLTVLCRLLLDGVAAAAFLVGGHLKSALAVAKAHGAFYRALPGTLRKRRAIAAHDAAQAPLAPYSVVWRSLVRGHHTYSSLQA